MDDGDGEGDEGDEEEPKGFVSLLSLAKGMSESAGKAGKDIPAINSDGNVLVDELA